MRDVDDVRGESECDLRAVSEGSARGGARERIVKIIN